MNPTGVEHYAYYCSHCGPRFEAAGVRVQFHGNQTPGIHFKVLPPKEYREAIVRGLQRGLDQHFPDFLKSGSLWVTEITVDEINSSQKAFYRASRLVIDQAHSLRSLREEDVQKYEDAVQPCFQVVEEIRQRMRNVPFVPFRVRMANRLEYPVPTANHVHVFPGQRVMVADEEGVCTVLPAPTISELI